MQGMRVLGTYEFVMVFGLLLVSLFLLLVSPVAGHVASVNLGPLNIQSADIHLMNISFETLQLSDISCHKNFWQQTMQSTSLSVNEPTSSSVKEYTTRRTFRSGHLG
jgi:hypothetical protein